MPFPPPPKTLFRLASGVLFSSCMNTNTSLVTFSPAHAAPRPMIISLTVFPFLLIQSSASVSFFTASLAPVTMASNVPLPPSSPRKLLIRPESASFSPASAAWPSSLAINSFRLVTAVPMASAISLNVGASAASASYFSLSKRALKSCIASSTSPRAFTLLSLTTATARPSSAISLYAWLPALINGFSFRQSFPKSRVAFSARRDSSLIPCR